MNIHVNLFTMKRVMVGLSGGVDSAVSAARLCDMGYEVVGVFIKVWHPDFLPCNWEKERRDAMRVAAHLKIPFLTCDAEKTYYEQVAKYFIESYRLGITPNPDVMCNRAVKFGTFWKFAQNYKFDFIATGHYARNHFDSKTSQWNLLRGTDPDKDQSYFLWSLNQNDLSHSLFPIGDSLKSEVRKEAYRRGIPMAEKADSQGICFLGQVDIPTFLKKFIDIKEGLVISSDGEIIGQHKGSICYTIGQRHGFQIFNNSQETSAKYIHAINHKENTLHVSDAPPECKSESLLKLDNVNTINKIPTDSEVTIQVRYRQKPIKSTIKEKNKNSITVKTHENIKKTAVGQSCVLFNNDICLGGGTIVT